MSIGTTIIEEMAAAAAAATAAAAAAAATKATTTTRQRLRRPEWVSKSKKKKKSTPERARHDRRRRRPTTADGSSERPMGGRRPDPVSTTVSRHYACNGLCVCMRVSMSVCAYTGDVCAGRFVRVRVCERPETVVAAVYRVIPAMSSPRRGYVLFFTITPKYHCKQWYTNGEGEGITHSEIYL